MRLRLTTLALGLTMIGAAAAYAQAPAPAAGNLGLKPLPQSYYDPDALPLYAGAAPGSEHPDQVESWFSAPNDLVARNVSRPMITPVLPVKKFANGAAVLVLPGGGNRVLSMGREGYDVANILANNGIAAFVLKYRVTLGDVNAPRQLPPGAAGAPASGAPPAGAPPAQARPTGPVLGVVDAKEALRWIRAHAKEYGIDPNRVGVVGFSAGAGNIWGVLGDNDPTAMPNFAAPIYGGFSARPSVPSNPPPLFVAGSADDPIVRNQPGFGVVEQWTKAGGKVELHFYQNGGHGFGAVKQGTSSDGFADEFVLWMRANGFLTPR